MSQWELMAKPLKVPEHDANELIHYGRRTRRLIFGLSVSLSLIIALAIPTVVFVIDDSNLESRANTHVVAVADSLSRLIASDPDFWMFRQVAVDAVLASHFDERIVGELLHIVVRDANGDEVTARGQQIADYALPVSATLHDGVRDAGTVEMTYSTENIFNDALNALAFSLISAVFFLLFIHLLPMRALDRTLQQIELDQARLHENTTRIAEEIKIREEIEEHLAMARKLEAMGTLLGGIAHSINNFLVPVTTLTGIVRDDLPANSEARDDLNRVIVAAVGAGDVLRDVLNFTRVTENPIDTCDINNTLRNTIPLAAAAAPANIIIDHALPEHVRQVTMKESDVQTIFLNLISNASDAIGPEGGRIVITTDDQQIDANTPDRPKDLDDGTYVRLSMADDGEGIPPNLITKIFDPFFTTKKVNEGSGLGLSVSYGLMGSAGGDIYVESEEGNGTRFDLYFPVSAGPAEMADQMDQSDPASVKG